MGMLISKIAVYVGGMGGISGCRLCAGACAAMECFADIRSFFSFYAIRNGIMRPRSSRPCLPCNPRRSTRERRGNRPLRMHASCMFESHRMHVGGASHLRGACKRALPASVAAPPAGDEWRKQPRVPRAAPLLSKRLRRAHRTIATGRRPRNLRAHALRADAQRRAFAQASRASLLRSCALALLRSCALVPSHLRPRRASLAGAPRSANQLSPRSSGHRYESNRDRAYAYSRTAPR
ncbi:Uncharacterised protein [Burkholderia pseudomallei]|nr:Uncharacterised protein [Burkholderia pseudomallei]CAJ3515610.1 Uncharacterised protein [Burkholderia pseudomallei]CAJ5324050.1 Uncharacterised protein [Burkholderia pseudomallei]CAJ6669022.1 Uncharacterised protein [Burkholderia pseudomallei]CAJ8130705.1 Uncharacterised protein [Burkholderia pseudomallei]